MPLKNLLRQIISQKNLEKAKILSSFFKTGKGQYGEGDKFLGLTVPQSRKISEQNLELSLVDLSEMLKNPWHEVRLIALLIAVAKFSKGNSQERKKIYNWYLKNTKYINNWDLVDTSADKIVGGYIFENIAELKKMENFAKSKNLWERRISILFTFAFIKKGQAEIPLAFLVKHLEDKHDLIHKASGWMLREVGKRCGEKTLLQFINKYQEQMPRTMLRYAIERLEEKLRKKYLAK